MYVANVRTSSYERNMVNVLMFAIFLYQKIVTLFEVLVIVFVKKSKTI